MELRQLVITLMILGVIVSGSFIFMSDVFNAYDVTDNIQNNSVLSSVVTTSSDYTQQAKNISDSTLGLGTSGTDIGVLGYIDFMVFGIYKTLVYTAKSLIGWVSLTSSVGQSDIFGESQIIGQIAVVIMAIILVTIAFLVANAIFKWRI